MPSILCPNQSTPEWKELVNALREEFGGKSEELAHLAFQRHIVSGGEGIPVPIVARDLLATRAADESAPQLGSYSVSAPAPMPEDAEMHRLASEFLGDRPEKEYDPSMQKGVSDARFASGNLAPLATKLFFATRSSSAFDAKSNFGEMMDYLRDHADTSLDLDAFATTLKRHFGKLAGVDTGKVADAAKDGVAEDAPAKDEAADPAGLNRALSEADDDRSSKMVEFNPVARLTALFADDKMMPGSRSFASFVDAMRAAKRRENPNEPEIDVSKLPAWLDGPRSSESLVSYFQDFLKGLTGTFADGSRDLGPAYHFLAQFNGGYGNRATSIFELRDDSGTPGYQLREQHDSAPAVNLSKLPAAAAEHLSNPENIEALYHFLVGDGYIENINGRDVQRPPVFRRGIDPKTGEKSNAAKTPSVPHQSPETGQINPERFRHPSYDQNSFLLDNLKAMSEEAARLAEGQEAEAKKAGPRAAEYRAAAEKYRRLTVSELDRRQRLSLVRALERVLGEQPAMRAALLNELTVAGTSEGNAKPFYYAAGVVQNMLWDVGQLVSAHRQKANPNLGRDVSAIVRRYLIDQKVGKNNASNRSQFEMLLGSLARKGTAKNPTRADGSKMAAAGFVGPIEERLRTSAELKKHLAEKLGYSPAEIRELEATGRYRDGTPLVMFDGGTRGEFKGRSYQKTPDKRHIEDLVSALDHIFTNPGRGVGLDYATFWTDQADSNKRLLFNLPRSIVSTESYGKAWDDAQKIAGGAVMNVPAKYRKQFTDAQGTKPLEGIPGGLPSKIKLAVILGRVNADGTLDVQDGKFLDGTLLQDPQLAQQERRSFGIPEGTMNKTHVIDAKGGKTFVKAATQFVVDGSKSPGNPLLDLHAAVGKALGFESYELTDSGGAKFFESQGTKDVVFGDTTYRVGYTEYPASFKRRTTELESSSKPHEVKLAAQDITDMTSLAGGEQHYRSAVNVSRAARAMRLASESDPNIRLTPEDTARLLKSSDASALAAELARQQVDPQDIPLFVDEIAQHQISSVLADAQVTVNGMHLVQRASAGGMVGDQTRWLGGKADPFVTDSYMHGPDGLVVPLIRTNDNDPTSRTGYWLRGNVDPEDFTSKVTLHVLAMRAGNTRDGMRLKAELNEMLVDTMGQTPHLKASFDDLVDADGKFDKAAIYKMGKSEHAPKGSHEDGLYVGGTLYHDVSRSPGTTMASHWPARRSEPVAWVERTRRSADPTKPAETYWGTAEANESVVHPRLVRAAGTDNDGDKWLVSTQYRDPKTGVAYRAEDTSPEAVSAQYRSELDAEFGSNPEKYGKKNQTTLNPAQVAARRAFAESRFSHHKRVLGNQVLQDGYAVFKAEAVKRSGQTLFGTRMMPEIGLKPFGENGERSVPHLNSGANSAIAKFNKDVSAERRAKIDSRLAGDGVSGNLESLAQKPGYVDIPYWLHIEIANGAGEEASADAAARRAAMNQESNQSREVAVAGVRNMNQAVRLLDARFTIPKEAILDDSGIPLFGDLTRDPTTVPEADRDRSNQLVDDFLCSIVNLNIDALKAPMPETAAAFMTSAWTGLEVPLLAAQTFKTPEEVLAFHTKFMKFAQGRFGQAYFETMRERNSVSRSEILDNDEALVTTEKARLNSRIRQAYVSLHPGDSAGAARAAKAFAALRDISDNLRTADSVANAHKGNLGYAQRLAQMGDSVESFGRMTADPEPGQRTPSVRLANKEVAKEVLDRANELRGIGNDLLRNSPASRLPGHFGETLADSINAQRAGDASMRDEVETYASDSLHALAAASLLPADLLQRLNSKPNPADAILSLAEAAIHKAYSEQTGNHLLQGLQTPEPSRKVITRMSGRDNSLALDKVGLEPYWEAARNMNGVRLVPGDTHFPLEQEVTLSARDMEHLMFHYSSVVHGANFRGKNGGFLRLLSPAVHQRVGEAVRKFSTSAPLDKQSAVAGRMTTQIGAKQMRVLDPVRGTRTLRVPLELESRIRGVEQKISNKKTPEVVSKEPAEQKRVVLEGTSPYLAKDQLKADLATKFIGRGSAASSTARYARAWGDRANSGKYDATDRVFISAEGARSSRLAPDFVEVQRALDARATIITDDSANRSRAYNSGEREVAEYLTAHGYVETKPGTWTPAAPKRETARVIAPAVETSDGGFVRGASHAEALKEAFPLMPDEQIEKIRASSKAKFLVEGGLDALAEKHGKTEADLGKDGTVQYLVSRKEAMEIAKQAAQLRDGFGNETELHSHMLEREDPGSYSVVDPQGKDERLSRLHEMDAQSLLHKMAKDDSFSRYEHGKLPGWLTWENMRRYWRQWSLRPEGRWGKKPLSPEEIQWLANHSDFHDRTIWDPILSAPDYETAVRRFEAIDTWPSSLSKTRGAQMKRQVRELMDYNPPKKWEEHRLKQVRKNEESVQARYDELMSRYIGLTDAEKELFHKAYEAKPEDILKDLFRAMRLGEAERDKNNNLEQRFKAVLDIAYASRSRVNGELPAQMELGLGSYSVAEKLSDEDIQDFQKYRRGEFPYDSEGPLRAAEKSGKLYRGLNPTNLGRTVVENPDGSLTLRKQDNFEGRTTGVSFTPYKAIAFDYATRDYENGTSRHTRQPGLVLELRYDSVPPREVVQENAEELSLARDITIPRGAWSMKRMSESDVLDVDAEVEQILHRERMRVASRTDKELVNEAIRMSGLAMVREMEGGGEEAATARAADPVTEKLFASYGRDLEDARLAYEEIRSRIGAAEDRVREIVRFSRLFSLDKDWSPDINPARLDEVGGHFAEDEAGRKLRGEVNLAMAAAYSDFRGNASAATADDLYQSFKKHLGEEGVQRYRQEVDQSYRAYDEARDEALFEADDRRFRNGLEDPFGQSYSIVEPDPDVKAAQLLLPGFPEAEAEAVRVKDAAKPAANTFSITASEEQRRLAEAALAPLGLQEDTPKVSLPKGIVLPPAGKKADVIGGTVDGDMANWKKETFVDPHEYMRTMLDYQMQLDGPNSLFRVVESWKNWAQHGATAARYTVRAVRDLLGLADSTGRLSNMIDVERPVVNTEALSEPGAPMTSGETETAQARGRMGFVAPWKGPGGKVGQAKQLDENERRLAYWTDLVLASWAAGPRHRTIPLSITIPNIESPVERMKAISAALKKTQEGKNPLPTEIATLLRQELANGNTDLIVLPSQKYGKTVLAVPVDLVEKAFMGSSYRAKLIATGRSEKMLTREGLTKMAQDHFASEYSRISGTASFLLDGEDGFAGALRRRQNYVPLRHGSGPVAHAVDKLERELQDLIDPSAKVSEEAKRVEAEYLHWLAPGQATVDSSAYGLPGGTKVPKSIYETPEWAMQQLHELLANEDPTLFREVPNRSNFITDMKNGVYEKFGLSRYSGYAEVLRSLEAANMRLLMRRKLDAEELHSPEDGPRPVELARALRTQLKGMPGEEPSFTRARAFETHQEAWEVAGLLPSSMSFTDLVADYGNRQMATMARRMILNQLLFATDIQGNPLIAALPNLEFKDSSSVIADQTWEHAARKWAAHFKVPYDEAKSGKENAHRIVSANVIGQSSDKFTDRFGRRTQYVVVPTAYSSVSQWYALQGRPDETRVVDMLIGGEAAEALKHTMETSDLWETNRIMSGLQDINQWMKLNALQLSFFHYKALIEDIESATWGKALLPKAIRAKDPSHIALGEWIRMLRTNDPYVKELTRVMDEVGITQSYGSVNPADIALGKTERGIEKMGSWLTKHMGDRWGKDFQAIAESMTGEQSAFLFEELNNVAKLMVVHTLLQKGRMAAYKAGRPFDPVAAMRPYNRYVNEAVGGLNPSHYAWATPRVRQMMNLGLFSWQWTIGAWNAAGGPLLTDGVLGSKMTPEALKFIRRRLPAMIALVLVAEPVVVQLGAYLAASAMGKTTDDDHAWMWENEEGKKTYADITPFAKMMPWWQGDKMSNNKNRRLYARWGKQIHELIGWLDDPIKTAGGKSSLVLQTAWGLATGRSMGTDWNLGFKNEGLVGWVSGRHGFEDSRLAYAGKNIVPVLGSFSVSQVLRNPDAGLLGLVGPTSRGTSYHVATQRAQVILSAWAESDHYRTFQGNQKIQTNLHALLADVLDDARANGYDPEDVLNASRKAILKAKYADMYAAVNANDQDAMERAAREILRLNGTVDGVRASVRNRRGLYGLPSTLTPEENKAVSEAFKEPELKRLQAERKAAQPKKLKPADQFAALRDYLAKKPDSPQG